MGDLSQWTACARPERRVMEGRYVRLEPLSAARHGDGLYAASSVPDAAERFRWLSEYAPENRTTFQEWLERNEASTDPIYFAVIDKASREIAGRQTLMRIDEKNGVGEIGHVYWGPLISRKPAATEALYLFARHIFDDLGYRRFEWKTNDLNEASKRAALRFGFRPEGVFRQHLVVKGKNRDTAWFAMIDGEWPAERRVLEEWLHPSNFDADGRQRRRLGEFREALRPEAAARGMRG